METGTDEAALAHCWRPAWSGCPSRAAFPRPDPGDSLVNRAAPPGGPSFFGRFQPRRGLSRRDG